MVYIVCRHGPLPKTYTDPAHVSGHWGEAAGPSPQGLRALYAPPAGSGAEVVVHFIDATWPLLELAGAKFMAALPHSLNATMTL